MQSTRVEEEDEATRIYPLRYTAHRTKSDQRCCLLPAACVPRLIPLFPMRTSWESSEDSSWPRRSWQMGSGQGGNQPRPPLSRLPRGPLPVARPPAATGSTVVKPRFYPRLTYSTPPLFTWQRKTGHSAIRTIPEGQVNARSQPEPDIHHVNRLAIIH